MLSCIAAVAIAAMVGKKTYESHVSETNNLLLQNVEALSFDGESERNFFPCYEKISSNEQYGKKFEGRYCGDCLTALMTRGWSESMCHR